MGKNNMGFFYGKLYNSCNRTFSVGNGEKFIGGTGLGCLVKNEFNVLHTEVGHHMLEFMSALHSNTAAVGLSSSNS